MSPDLTEIVNAAEKAVGLAPEAKPAAAGGSDALNGEVDGEEDDEDEADEGAAAGTGKLRVEPKV
jgi:ribosomal protein L12E/L44/L45/RPP1/RPP2